MNKYNWDYLLQYTYQVQYQVQLLRLATLQPFWEESLQVF